MSDRVAVLEHELEQLSGHVQRFHHVGKLKAIGLLEAAEGAIQLLNGKCWGWIDEPESPGFHWLEDMPEDHPPVNVSRRIADDGSTIWLKVMPGSPGHLMLVECRVCPVCDRPR